MEIAGVHEKATAFEGAATVYEQSRPGYPAEAVRWLTEVLGLGPGRRVVDLAAGTGKLTRDLVGSGAQVIAVEPVDGMRRTLATTTPVPAGGPAVSVVAAVAQALPVGEGRIDAITVAQGFHWFATDQALRQMHRALRPGGKLGLIWNHRDLSHPLQAAMTEVMEPLRGTRPRTTPATGVGPSNRPTSSPPEGRSRCRGGNRSTLTGWPTGWPRSASSPPCPTGRGTGCSTGSGP